MLVFVIFYGLDWVATVPPTVALSREVFGPAQGTVVFGWVFAAHQIGAATAAGVAGVVRTSLGTYTLAWWSIGVICLFASGMSLSIGRGRQAQGVPSDPPVPAAA
jgi:hypothetical protein